MKALDKIMLRMGDAMARIIDFRLQYFCDDEFRALADMWLYHKNRRAKNWTLKRIGAYLKEQEMKALVDKRWLGCCEYIE